LDCSFRVAAAFLVSDTVCHHRYILTTRYCHHCILVAATVCRRQYYVELDSGGGALGDGGLCSYPSWYTFLSRYQLSSIMLGGMYVEGSWGGERKLYRYLRGGAKNEEELRVVEMVKDSSGESRSQSTELYLLVHVYT
jgi:hypothetical protein